MTIVHAFKNMFLSTVYTSCGQTGTNLKHVLEARRHHVPGVPEEIHQSQEGLRSKTTEEHMTNPIFVIVMETKVYRRKPRRIAEVFVNTKDRPLFDRESGGILRDLVWQREHVQPVESGLVKVWVAEQLGIPADLLTVRI